MKLTAGIALTLCAFAVMGTGAGAATYEVGAGKAYTTLKSLPALQPGDVVAIQPGTYNEYAKWTADGTAEKPITIRGVGATRPIIEGKGLEVSGRGGVPRALFQIEGDHYVIENLQFQNAQNKHNGAGIRIVGAKGTTIRNCVVTRCEMGMMSNDNDDLLIEYCEFGFNGNPEHFNGYAHNLYLEGGKTTVRFSHIHDAHGGINFKSRGRYTELLYNLIADSNGGEISLVDSKKTVGPNSNAVLIGNIIVSKADRTGNTGKFIDFGQDMGGTRDGTLTLIHNTLIAGSPRIQFLWTTAPGAKIVAFNNIFSGSDAIIGIHKGSVRGSHNGMPQSADIPPTFTDGAQVADPGFRNAAARDFHLTATSPYRNIGMSAPMYLDAMGASQPGIPSTVPHWDRQGFKRRVMEGQPDAGAYEYQNDRVGIKTK